MTARALTFVSDVRCLILGLATLATGGLAFLLTALLAAASPSVGGIWLVLPCAVMVLGASTAGTWLILGEGGRHFDPTPVADQTWHWSRTTR